MGGPFRLSKIPAAPTAAARQRFEVVLGAAVIASGLRLLGGEDGGLHVVLSASVAVTVPLLSSLLLAPAVLAGPVRPGLRRLSTLVGLSLTSAAAEVVVWFLLGTSGAIDGPAVGEPVFAAATACCAAVVTWWCWRLAPGGEPGPAHRHSGRVLVMMGAAYPLLFLVHGALAKPGFSELSAAGGPVAWSAGVAVPGLWLLAGWLVLKGRDRPAA
ncbi:MAG: hypothetical protein ACYDH5_09020 [Acidimicrobiales bacterium]